MIGVVLPAGTFSFGVQVRDAESVVTASVVQDCKVDVTVQSSRCIDLKYDVLMPFLDENELLMSKRSQYVYILQTIQSALLYVGNNKEDCNCSYTLFASSIDLLSEFFGRNSTNLCESPYVLVCSLLSCDCDQPFVFSFWLCFSCMIATVSNTIAMVLHFSGY